MSRGAFSGVAPVFAVGLGCVCVMQFPRLAGRLLDLRIRGLMLTAANRAELRVIMEEKIQELEASVASLKERMETVSPDLAIGRLSRMDSLVNQGTVEMALSEESKKLNRLRDRIQRLDEEDFGRCALCNEWISLERLIAAPDRGVCVACMQARQPPAR